MEYNPFFPEVRENPYPYYAYLRRHAPVYEVPGAGFWVATRYDDVFYMLRNPQLFSSSIFFDAMLGDLNPFPPEAPALISVDPPGHTRLRKLVNRAFTPRRVASLETRMRAITHQLLDQAIVRGEFDVVSDLAIPLPILVIAELLGIPQERYRDFKRWTDSVVKAGNGAAVTEQDRVEIRQTLAEADAYFQAAIAAYRQQPGDNLLSDLVRAEEENQTLTSAEVMSMALLVLLGGAETTANMIGNTVLVLQDHPDQLAKVQANPTLIPQVVEESMRYNAPVQKNFRQTTTAMEFGGAQLPAGTLIMAVFASANRDERKFPEPDRFDILRNTEGHLGFGFGIHFCLGAPLARLEGKVVLEELLQRFPRLERLNNHVTWVESIIVRGPKSLPLIVGGRSS